MSAKSVRGEGGKKPASAATNLLAGGGAGMMEALVCHPLDNQSADAIVEEKDCPGTEKARVRPDWEGHRQERDGVRIVQGPGCGFDGHCAQDGDPIYFIRVVQTAFGRSQWSSDIDSDICRYVDFPNPRA
jgi:hypothetical protein